MKTEQTIKEKGVLAGWLLAAAVVGVNAEI